MKTQACKLAWGVLLVGTTVTWWACRSGDGIPSDLAPARVTPAELAAPSRVRGGPGELVWGGWHPVLWDPRAADALEEAYRLQLQGEREDAIAILNTGLGFLPDSASLIEARGALYAAMGYRRAAARDFEETCELAPERARAWCALGRMRQELGLENTALEALRRAAELGLEAAPLDLVLARTYHGLGRPGRAAEHYGRALAATANPPFELQVEAARLFYEGEGVSSEAVDRALGRMATELAGDSVAEDRMWEVHHLLRDLRDKDPETIASGLTALDVDPEALALWTRLALLAVRMDDRETRTELEGGVALRAPEPR